MTSLQTHIPQRTCIACRQAGPKPMLLRIARVDGEVRFDASGKIGGRGAYVHRAVECVTRFERRLAPALRTKVARDDTRDIRFQLEGQL